MEKIELEIELNASPERIYNDWLSSEGHTNMTGGEAIASSELGSTYTAWDDYISGTTIETVPNSKIVQKWRTVEFPESAEDSILEIHLEGIEGNKTRLKLIHTNLQKGDGQKYSDGWEMHYFEPMTEFYK
jgi:uncharacterized protein YndB with AHSA1/START domain